MALTVETGSGSATADSYVSRTDATTYHTDRGNTAWGDLGDEEKDAALRRATDYLGQTYGLAWTGERVSTTQALDFPRYNVPRNDGTGQLYASTVVPSLVVRACNELALRAAAGDLAADLGQTIETVKAGSVEVTYAPNSTGRKTYPAVSRLLAPLLNGGGSSYVSLSKS